MAEEQATKGITEPGENDVLCGRGGAALRHPGNQTYRRLVNLNKGLYTTCLKTEKLKISRSIVAAIREQRGRFLEKDTKNGTWYDIGDKKAIEKTSQALREGQPKLRQKIVEMGGTAAAMESQFGHTGIYADQANLHGSANFDNSGPIMMPGSPLRQQHQHAAAAAAQVAAMRQHELRSMQLPIVDPQRENLHAEMFQRLSLRDLNSGLQQEDAARMQQFHQQQRNRLRSSYHQRNDLGMGFPVGSQLSLMSDFSAIGSAGVPNESMMSMESSFRRQIGQVMNSGSQYSLGMDTIGTFGSYGASQRMNNQAHLHPMHSGSQQHFGHPSYDNSHSHQPPLQQQQQQQQQQPQQQQQQQQQKDKFDGVDRRRVFAKMKYTRPPSAMHLQGQKLDGTNHSVGDGMPDIHMVESSLSLYSNLSAMTDGQHNKTSEVQKSIDLSIHKHLPPGVETVKVVDHSRDIHWGGLGGGSRHSVMSGLSRIDGLSEHSLFSDMKKGINTSTRSMAMSEISAFDVNERDNEDESSSDSSDSFAHPEGVPSELPRKVPAMDFDL